MPTNKRKSSAARPAREHEVPQPNSDSVVPSSSIQKQVITSPFVVTLSRQAGNDAHATAAARTIWYVRPDSIWASLAKYRNFTMKDHTYSVHQYAVISRPQPLPEPLHPIDDDNIQCIARILEIRALNPANVYVRVYWLYRPDELRGGRQNYHGTQELIATNHMEIVDALRVLSPIDVVHWKEEQSSGIPQGDLYWRQFYDVTTQMASTPRAHCICKQPVNPERSEIQCTDPECKMVYHRPCLVGTELRRLNQLHGSSQPDSSKYFEVTLIVSQRDHHKGATRYQITDLSTRRAWERNVQCLNCGTRISS